MEFKSEGARLLLHKHRALLALGALALVAELGYAVMNFSALPVYVSDDLNAGKALGLILAAFLVTDSVLRPGFGVMGDRIGRKPLLLLGPLISMFTGVLSVVYDNVWWFGTLRVLDGIGSAALWPTAFAVISDIVDEKNRSTAMGILNVTYMGGIALGPLMGGVVNEYFGMHEASFYLVSVLFLAAFVMGIATFPKEAGRPHHVDLPEAEQHAFKLTDLLHSLKVVPDMLVFGFVTFLGIGLLMPIVKPYAMQQFGLTETHYGLALAPVAAALAVFAVPLGRLGDKWGKNRSVCYGLAGSAVAMWLIATVHNMIIGGICASILGIGFISAFPAWLALTAERTAPSRRGEVLGAVGTAQGIGSILGASLGGFLYFSSHLTIGTIESINLPFYGSAILLTIATFMSFLWVCRGGKSCRIPQD